MTLTSHTPAHSQFTTVAPFRAWRGSRLPVARGPERATIEIRLFAEPRIIRLLSRNASFRSDFQPLKTKTAALGLPGLRFWSGSTATRTH